MQLSTPIDAIGNGNFVPESASSISEGGSSAVWGLRLKKTKPGIFAKLLEGLIAKKNSGSFNPRAVGQNSGESETSEFPAEFTGSVKTGKTVQKTESTKKILNFNNENAEAAILASAESRAGKNLAFLRQARLQAEAGAKTGSGDLNATLKNQVLPFPGQLPGTGQDQQKEAGVFPAGRAGEKRPSGLNPADFSPWRQRNQNQEQDTFYVSFRDMEAKFSQVQGPAGFLRNADGENGNSRLSDLKNRKNRLNIEVKDFRTDGGQSQAGDAGKGQIVNFQRPLGTEIEIPVNLSFSEGNGEAELYSRFGRESNSAKFEEALARELRSGLSNDIVRDATVVLRNGGEGSIRLSLRPASLGDVKIRLEMTENKITGHIIVESSEALRAFERELPVLEKAFKDSGFSETNLEMSLAQDMWNSESGAGQQEGDFESLSPVIAASRYEAKTEWIEETPARGLNFSASSGRTPVNLLV